MHSSKRIKPYDEDTERLTKKNRLEYLPYQLPTPATAGPSPISVSVPTVRLSLKIPVSDPPTDEEKRKLAAQKGAAKRWQPKLGNPYPKEAEVRKAYKLKLMRHYTGPSQGQSFVKPILEKSERVMSLLRKHPVITMPDSRLPADEIDEAELQLQENRAITSSPKGIELAWDAFAHVENCEQRIARQALRESGLASAEMRREEQGFPNALPEWKKRRTGKFKGKVVDLTSGRDK